MRIPKKEKNNKSTKQFTPAEDLLLIKRYGKVSWTELKGLFSDRTIETVIHHAEEILGLKRDFPGSYPRSGGKSPWYWKFGYCYRHGKIPIKKLKKDSGGGLICPICNRRIRTRPRSSKHKEKYIIEREIKE